MKKQKARRSISRKDRQIKNLVNTVNKFKQLKQEHEVNAVCWFMVDKYKVLPPIILTNEEGSWVGHGIKDNPEIIMTKEEVAEVMGRYSLDELKELRQWQ